MLLPVTGRRVADAPRSNRVVAALRPMSATAAFIGTSAVVAMTPRRVTGRFDFISAGEIVRHPFHQEFSGPAKSPMNYLVPNLTTKARRAHVLGPVHRSLRHGRYRDQRCHRDRN
jgi:hypothetical protein